MYSWWHREENLSRFLNSSAKHLGQIDIDSIELDFGFCDTEGTIYTEYVPREFTRTGICSEPVALIETAMDTGQRYKECALVRQYAMAVKVCWPWHGAWCVLYKPTLDHPHAIDGNDIESFRVSNLADPPRFFERERVMDWQTKTPQEYADFLIAIRCGWKQRNPRYRELAEGRKKSA